MTCPANFRGPAGAGMASPANFPRPRRPGSPGASDAPGAPGPPARGRYGSPDAPEFRAIAADRSSASVEYLACEPAGVSGGLAGNLPGRHRPEAARRSAGRRAGDASDGLAHHATAV